MDLLEKDLEDLVIELVHNQQEMTKRGLYVFSKKFFRQPDIGNYGRADIVGVSIFNGVIDVSVIELKKGTIDVKAFLQAIRYIKGIETIIRAKTKRKISFNIILIGKEIELESSFCYLPDYIQRLSIYTYNFDLYNGLNFKAECNYNILDTGVDQVNIPIKLIKDCIV